MFVAQQIGILERFDVADTVGRTQRPRRLVFETAGCTPVFGLVDHREVALVDFRNPTAGDRAAETGGVGDQLRFAVRRAFFVHRLGRDLRGVLELDVSVISRRQRAHLVDHVHQHLRAEFRQSLPGHGVVGEHFLGLGGALEEGREIVDAGHPDRAAQRHRLEILRAHHRADTGAPGGAVQVIDDACEQHLILTRTPDRRDANLRILMLLLDRLFGLPAALAPQVRRIAQLGTIILDEQIDRRGRLALEYDHVPAGKLHLGAEEAARVGAGDGVGQRPLGDDRVASAGRRHGAGQRTGRT